MSTVGKEYQQVAARPARDELVISNLSLVRHIISRLVAELPPGIDEENLESAGILGLVEAANRFEPARGIEFRAFAYPRVRGAVLDELRRNCPLPQDMLQRLAKVRRAYEKLEPPVAVEDLARATDLSHDEVVDCLAAIRLTRMVSWENLGETLHLRLDDPHDRPPTILERAEQKQILTEAIASLPDRERQVVTLYYMEDLRLKEIGQVLDLSESRVSRLLQAALFHLGECLRKRQSI